MIVAKFGGSVLSDGKNWQKVLEVCDKATKEVVVVSAPGARYKGDKKITDLLFEYFYASNEKSKLEIWKKIASRYNEIASFFGKNIEDILEETRLATLKAPLPFVISRGEYLSATLFALVSGRSLIEASRVIRLDQDEKVLINLTKQLVLDAVKNAQKPCVLGGFYGSNMAGEIRLFERGGSDVTGAWVSYALDTEIYENWTDVSGFFVCDPRIVFNPVKVNCMSYYELKILSSLGAQVLHPQSIYPIKLKNLPINIKSVFKPYDKGTMILPQSNFEGDIIGITATEGVLCDFLQVDFLPNLPKSQLLFFCENCGFCTAVIKKDAIQNLQQNCQAIIFKKEITLISLLGDKKTKYAQKVLDALTKLDIDGEVLCDKFGLCMCVAPKDSKDKVLNGLYHYFF
ncbi:MAG: hypothetical protein IKV38_01235 [Clostridia bacterium]|nr:hypothetical protein [Clostridia bacterium]